MFKFLLLLAIIDSYERIRWLSYWKYKATWYLYNAKSQIKSNQSQPEWNNATGEPKHYCCCFQWFPLTCTALTKNRMIPWEVFQSVLPHWSIARRLERQISSDFRTAKFFSYSSSTTAWRGVDPSRMVLVLNIACYMLSRWMCSISLLLLWFYARSLRGECWISG